MKSSFEIISIKPRPDGQVEVVQRVLSAHEEIVERAVRLIRAGTEAFKLSETEPDRNTEYIEKDDSEIWDALEEIRAMIMSNREKIVGLIALVGTRDDGASGPPASPPPDPA